MKNFELLRNEIKLIDAVENELGMMYQEIDVSPKKMRVVRHFHDQVLVPIYEDLYCGILKWIENSEINDYVFMPNLIEIGQDFIIRHWYVYYVSIYRYFDENDEDYVEPPELFYKMKNFMAKEFKEASGSREGVIQNILRKSLLKPTAKTVYDSRYMNKFIIVEPKISLKDLNDWKLEM